MKGIRQIVLSCVLVAILGSIVKLAVFPQALIAANVDSATRQTAFLVAFGVTKAAGNFFVGAAADRYGRRWTHLSGWYIGLLLPVLLLIFAHFTSDGASLNQKASKYTNDITFPSNASTDISHLKFVLAPPLKSCASACASMGLACDSLEFLSDADTLQAFKLSSHSWCNKHSSMSPTGCNFTKWPVVCEHVFTVGTGSARINLGSRNCSKPLPGAEQGMAQEGACNTQGQGPWQQLCRCSPNLANEYWWILVLSDAFLGLNQAVCWSTNIFILIDLLGPRKKGLAISLSDGIGYLFGAVMPLVAASMTTHYTAESPFYLIAALMAVAAVVGTIFLRESKPQPSTQATPGSQELLQDGVVEGLDGDSARENDDSDKTGIGDDNGGAGDSRDDVGGGGDGPGTGGAKEPGAVDVSADVNEEKEYSYRNMMETFLATSLRPRTLVLCFGGLCVNFLTALVWGLTTTWAKKIGLSATMNAVVSVVFVLPKALAQLIVGFWSDRVANRKRFVVIGFLIASAGVIFSSGAGFIYAQGGLDSSVAISGLLMVGALLMGLGTGAVYPLLQAGVADHFSGGGGKCMASAIGTYRFWRDLGYAVGGLCTGALSDVSGSYGLTALLSSIVSVAAAVTIGLVYRDPDSLTSGDDKVKRDKKAVTIMSLTDLSKT